MKSNSFNAISIIIPTFNEEANIEPLIRRIHEAFSNEKITYELIFIDDHSTDQTRNIISKFATFYPITLMDKQGKKGKAFSIYEGIRFAQYDVVGMIDADLQYPPEALPEMLHALDICDVVVANRKYYKDSIARKVLSKVFRFTFGKALFGLNHDIQSGLKVFRREVFETIKFMPSSPWTFDLEFLHRANQAGFQIQNFDIVFSERKNGNSKVGFLGTTLEIGFNALRVRAKRIHPAHIAPKDDSSMLGAGIGYKKKKYITHTTISHHLSALNTFTKVQKAIFGLVLIDIGLGLIIAPLLTLKIVVGILSAIYFADFIFNLFLIIKSLSFPQEITSTEEELNVLIDQDLPVYTILCPLYKEAVIIPQFMSAIEKLLWPKNKLDVIFLLEEDDKTTIDAVSKMNLPSFVRTLVVPHSIPKTKPKACNYGLAHARGEYLVIYDAEDIPDPDQLQKAYLGFKKVDGQVICLQAKLNYYNPHQNLLTRFFTAEYSLWFDVTLPGLQSINTTLPLGGTSNHFKTASLRSLEGWDPFNVTEDADLGVRLFRKGYRTAMIDSTTLEEANSKVGNWFRQRSRWVKGYMQTYLVHTRGNSVSAKGQSLHSLIFQLVIGGKIAFLLINPILWFATLSYFALYAHVGSAIEALYPSAVFYMAATSLVLGNFLFLYYYMIGLAKKNQWNLIKFVFLVPIYWLMISISGFIALYQLIFKPHYWEKTVHGFHLEKSNAQAEEVREELKVIPQTQPADHLKGFSRPLFRDFNTGIGVVIFASLIASSLNLLYNVLLVRTHIIDLEEFALISVIGSILALTQIPLSGFSRTITHRSAYLFGKYDTPIKSFWSKMRIWTIKPSILLTLLWLASTPLLVKFFNTDTILPFLLLTPIWTICLAASVDYGFLNGNLKLKTIGLMTIAEALSKFVITFLVIQFGLLPYVYIAIPLSVIVSFLIGWAAARRFPKENIVIDPNVRNHFPKKFYASSVLIKLSSIAYLNVDILLAMHYLTPIEAGQYAILSLVGKMVYFLGTQFTQFINPFVSLEEGAGRDSKKMFVRLMTGSILAVAVGIFAFGTFGQFTVPLILGSKSLVILQYLPMYTIAMGCLVIGSGIVSYRQSRHSHLFAAVSFIYSTLALGSIYFYHDSISEINQIVVVSGVLYLVLMLCLHLFAEPAKRFLSDLFSIFSVSTSANGAYQNGNIRILIFNWRDTKHKWAGGAEIYIHEIAKRWAKEGNEVTLFCGKDGSSPRNSVIDGVNIIRRGGFYTVYVWALFYYMLRFRGKYDLIIDSENGIPFFTPMYAKKPVLLIVYHVHQEVFRQHLKFPLSSIARFLEGSLMPRVYRNSQVITISQSSKDDILKLGLGKKSDVSIVYPGIETSLFKREKKAENPLFAYIGRLKPYKNVDDVIRAFDQVVKSYPQARFIVVGEGESLGDLQRLTRELDLEKSVSFTGRVSNSEKAKILAKSWVVLQPSMVEGWGITVIEANAAGTPVIASEVNGLKDSVVHSQTGMLVPVKDIDAFALAMIDFILDAKYRKTLSDNAYSWSQRFSWDDSAEAFIKILKDVLPQERSFVRVKQINIFQKAG